MTPCEPPMSSLGVSDHMPGLIRSCDFLPVGLDIQACTWITATSANNDYIKPANNSTILPLSNCPTTDCSVSHF
jgi:hypothetical protein